MRILVFEYISGGGMRAESLPAALAREGDLMLRALLRDLCEMPEVQPVALRDARLGIPADVASAVTWIPLTRHDDVERRFRAAIETADAVWPIAPETGGVLETLCGWVESTGKPLLTSPAAAVRIAASKRATVRRLEAHGIETVPTHPLDPAMTPTFPLVAKPDDGVGGEGARILETIADWHAFVRENPLRNTVIQPLVEGEALSLSVLFAQGEARLLACNRQHIIREGGGFVLRGCGVNAIGGPVGTFRALAERIGAAMPELWGYVGIDLMRNQGNPSVLEINPRLTTSYAGLRRSTGLNPAELILNTWRLGRLPEFAVHAGSVVEISLESLHAG